MKTILTKFLVLSGVTLLMLSSCKKDGVLVTSNGGKSGALTASATTLVLNKASLTDPTMVMTFNFTAPTYGFSAAVTNTLQIDAAGDNWVHPMSVTLGTNVLTQGYSTADFNALLLKLGLVGGTTSQVNVRIASTISSTITPNYSNVVNLTVTPFNLKSWLYITGAFSNWVNPGAAEDSLLSATSNGIYVGIINFTAGNNQFLILPAKNWNNKYATSGSSVPSTTVTYNASYNLYAPTAAGQYLVTFNLNTGTINFALADYYSVIGSAPPGTAWNTDTPMKYINDGSGTWMATNVPMIVGEYKFRQDNQWSKSWGPSATAGVVVSSNAIGDGNIQLTVAGNYNLSFVGNATPYGTAIDANAGDNNIATTTYSAVKQ